MDLRIRFNGFENGDVVTTSGCAYKGEDGSYQFLYVDSFDYLIFKATNSVQNYHGDNGNSKIFMGYDGEQYICDTEGNLSESYESPVAGKWYHYDPKNDILYLCENPAHHGTWEDAD